MTDILKDISTLTTIPRVLLARLTEKGQACICHAVEESILKHETITSVNLEIGVLNISTSDDEIRYKFIPNPKFEESLKTTVLTKESPLILDIEEVLKDKIASVYKDLY